MEVSPLDMQEFLSGLTVNVSTKHIWISAKDLHTNLKNEATGNIDGGEVTALLGSTKMNNACRNNESDTSDTSSKPNANSPRKIVSGIFE